VLEGIKPPASPSFVAKARYLRGAAHQEDEQWEEAAKLWEEALADRTAPPPDPARVRYWLGVCYRNLDRPQAAMPGWEETSLWKAGTEEGAVAALGLAELRLLDDKPTAALEAFESALRYVKTPVEWQNSLLGIAKAREAFERAGKTLRERGDYEQAMQLARLYERLATPPTAAYLFPEPPPAQAPA